MSQRRLSQLAENAREKNASGITSVEWPLGEGAAKPGIDMARRAIIQQKRNEILMV